MRTERERVKMDAASGMRDPFIKIERSLLNSIEGCRKLRLSTAVELLELALAEIRDQANSARIH